MNLLSFIQDFVNDHFYFRIINSFVLIFTDKFSSIDLSFIINLFLHIDYLSTYHLITIIFIVIKYLFIEIFIYAVNFLYSLLIFESFSLIVSS